MDIFLHNATLCISSLVCLKNTIIVFQIFLYSHGEVPFVRDLGFAVGPGDHALVGVTLSQVKVTESIYNMSNKT